MKDGDYTETHFFKTHVILYEKTSSWIFSFWNCKFFLYIDSFLYRIGSGVNDGFILIGRVKGEINVSWELTVNWNFPRHFTTTTI